MNSKFAESFFGAAVVIVGRPSSLVSSCDESPGRALPGQISGLLSAEPRLARRSGSFERRRLGSAVAEPAPAVLVHHHQLNDVGTPSFFATSLAQHSISA